MKKFYLSVVVVCFALIAKAQQASLEKSTYGIQTDLTGLWIHHESRQNDKVAIRSEIGLEHVNWSEKLYGISNLLILTPVLTIEPRYYYNLNKRALKLKRTDGNSANYLSVNTSFHPSWFAIFNKENLSTVSALSFIPTCGMRRNFGEHLTLEAGIGAGYRCIYTDRLGFSENLRDPVLSLHLRVGYRIN